MKKKAKTQAITPVEPSVFDSLLAEEEQAVVASISATSVPAHFFFADEYTAM